VAQGGEWLNNIVQHSQFNIVVAKEFATALTGDEFIQSKRLLGSFLNYLQRVCMINNVLICRVLSCRDKVS
jgi:hypothetical protein